MGWVYFYLGMTLGTLLGIGIMCLVSYAKEPQDLPSSAGELWSKTHKSH